MSILTTTIMKCNDSVRTLDYVRPEIEVRTVSVEKGFAGSGFGDMGYAGDDLSSEGNEYDF